MTHIRTDNKSTRPMTTSAANLSVTTTMQFGPLISFLHLALTDYRDDSAIGSRNPSCRPAAGYWRSAGRENWTRPFCGLSGVLRLDFEGLLSS